jgi:hypothetical protein
VCSLLADSGSVHAGQQKYHDQISAASLLQAKKIKCSSMLEINIKHADQSMYCRI